MEPIDERTTSATLLLSLDPKIKLIPQRMLEAGLRRSMCLLFWQLRRSAVRLGRGEGAHAAAVAADPRFYDGLEHLRLDPDER